MQPTDFDWGERLPHDYTYIVKWSKDIEESVTRNEVYFLLRKGLYINDSQQLCYLHEQFYKKKNRNGIFYHCQDQGYISLFLIIFFCDIHDAYHVNLQDILSLPSCRFNEAAESCNNNNNIVISFQIESQLLSTGIMYACYLVYKLPENASVFEGMVYIASFETQSRTHVPIEHHIYLVTPPHTPIIEQSPGELPSRTRKIKGHPKLRKDGWMEIQVYELYNGTTSYHSYRESGYLKSLNEWSFKFHGVIPITQLSNNINLRLTMHMYYFLFIFLFCVCVFFSCNSCCTREQ
ncbi:putative phloem protein [Helianthus anomalus]